MPMFIYFIVFDYSEFNKPIELIIGEYSQTLSELFDQNKPIST